MARHVREHTARETQGTPAGPRTLLRPRPLSAPGRSAYARSVSQRDDDPGTGSESTPSVAMELPLPEPGDLVAIGYAGAYGRVMASTYNARTLCAEVLVDGGSWRVIREAGTYEDLVRGESA